MVSRILSVVLAWGLFRCWGEKKPSFCQKVAVVIFACSSTWHAFIGFVLVLMGKKLKQKPKRTFPEKEGVPSIHEVYVTAVW